MFSVFFTPFLRNFLDVVYRNRPSAKCVIHTHSMNAQMATLLDPTETSDTLNITHLEMLKGVGNHAYDDQLEIPIIDNRPSEDLLADQLEAVIQKYPKCNAVLVRRHGKYSSSILFAIIILFWAFIFIFPVHLF